MKKSILSLGVLAIAAQCAFAGPKIDTSADRVGIKLDINYANLGTLVPKNVSQVKNNLTLGCETVDRDYTDYHQYKEYLAPLGMKKIRLQAGWAKTEKVKGTLDFKWLDDIIDDAVARGLTPWVETAYGNPVYEGGGTAALAGGMPTSKEAKAAWDKWVEAMAVRYKGKVVEWEIWNEPDIGKTNTAADVAYMNIHTAQIIKKIDPNAQIAGLALASVGGTEKAYEKIESYLKKMAEYKDSQNLFKWFSYHGYVPRPEETNGAIDNLFVLFKKYFPNVLPRMGENGAPSKGFMGGALTKFHWTETSQAKWALRRMLTDHGRGIETSIFCICDMNYAATDHIKMKNVKGLLGSDDNNKIIKIKKAYYAVQNMVSIFDMLENRFKSELTIDTDIDYTSYAYADKKSGYQIYTVWYSDTQPSGRCGLTPSDVTIKNGKFKDPVLVDILTGYVFHIPSEAIAKDGDTYKFKGLPLYDSPMIITDKSLLDFKK